MSMNMELVPPSLPTPCSWLHSLGLCGLISSYLHVSVPSLPGRQLPMAALGPDIPWPTHPLGRRGHRGPESEPGADWWVMLGAWVPDHGGMWAPAGVLLGLLGLLVLWGEVQLEEAHSGALP